MSCLDKLISAELEPSLRGKLLVWLAEIESIDGKLLVCEKQQVESLTLAKADFQYSCGSLKMKSGLASVVLAFSSHPKVDGLRLVNIHH